MRDIDDIIARLLREGRLRADLNTGQVFSPLSNTPQKPIGTLTKKGYLRACIHVDGTQVHVMIHRVIWVAAHGALPETAEAALAAALAERDAARAKAVALDQEREG